MNAGVETISRCNRPLRERSLPSFHNGSTNTGLQSGPVEIPCRRSDLALIVRGQAQASIPSKVVQSLRVPQRWLS